MFNKRVKIALLGMLVLSSCAHIGERPSESLMSRDELLTLKSQMESFIAEDVLKKQKPRKIHKIEVAMPEEANAGAVRIPYQLSYETESEEAGSVSHEFEAVAFLERASDRWKIVRIDAGHEVMKFDKPLLVTAKKLAP